MPATEAAPPAKRLQRMVDSSFTLIYPDTYPCSAETVPQARAKSGKLSSRK